MVMIMEGEKEARRTPILLTVVILAMLIMSLIALFIAIRSSLTRRTIEIEADIVNIILSVSALSLSVYLLLQMRRRTMALGLDKTRVVTVIKCASCGYGSTREFEKGDYVLREVGQCPRCNGTLLIHSIFRESKQEGKKEKF